MGWRWVFLLGLGVVSVGMAPQVWGHGAQIDYRTVAAIEIQALYDTGAPLGEAQVTIYAPEDPASVWLRGTTDEQGRFVFRPDPDQPGNWEVTVRQSGHGDIVVIPVESSEASPDKATGTEAVTLSAAQTSLSPLQKGLMAASVLWGCVGTALFFSRSRS